MELIPPQMCNGVDDQQVLTMSLDFFQQQPLVVRTCNALEVRLSLDLQKGERVFPLKQELLK